MNNIERKILLNPGPATTTDTVKLAQLVPDICPREKEFGDIMRNMRNDLVKIVHGDPDKYTSVMFCGSGTINIDACLSSLLPADKSSSSTTGLTVPELWKFANTTDFPTSI